MKPRTAAIDDAGRPGGHGGGAVLAVPAAARSAAAVLLSVLRVLAVGLLAVLAARTGWPYCWPYCCCCPYWGCWP